MSIRHEKGFRGASPTHYSIVPWDMKDHLAWSLCTAVDSNDVNDYA